MDCKYQKNIYRLVDGELKGADQAQLQKHLQGCLVCQKEVWAIQKLNALIKTNAISVEPSPNFDGIFWQKVLQRENEPWVASVLRHLENLIPTPNLAQAFAVLLLALLIGGTGGFVATASTLSPQQMQANRASVQYLSGFQEFAGVPSSSVAASYLKMVERKS